MTFERERERKRKSIKKKEKRNKKKRGVSYHQFYMNQKDFCVC